MSDRFEKYLERPDNCPFCHSIRAKIIKKTYPDSEGVILEEVECSFCQKTWMDVYKLVGAYMEEE